MRWAIATGVGALAISGIASAHAPIARQAIVGTRASLVRMPGFGFIVARADGQPVYACDALLGLDISDRPTVMAVRSDGGMVFGDITHAPQIVDENGCNVRASSGWPSELGVSAMGAAPETPDTLYAFTAEVAPRVLRSVDGGERWQPQATLTEGSVITGVHAVVIDGTEHVYATREALNETHLLHSDDAGVTFDVTRQGSNLSLVGVDPADTPTLWFVSPRPASDDMAILSGRPDLTDLSVRHRVRFFGGLALDPLTHTIWIADEAGPLWRAQGSGVFSVVNDDYAVSCLTHAGGQLWACAPGTPDAPAWLQSRDEGQTFAPVFAFQDVTELTRCASTDVPAACASAWTEWQRDVLRTDEASDVDATTNADASDTPPRATTADGCSCQSVGATREGSTWWSAVMLSISAWSARTWRSARTRSSRHARR